MPQAPPALATDAPLVVDMSSNFCARPVDVSKYGVIYAGAQKNIGPAGVTIVIVREDLLGAPRPDTPTMLNWTVAAENGSMYNTPPCWAIYMCGLVFAHMLEQGGLQATERRNEEVCVGPLPAGGGVGGAVSMPAGWGGGVP